MIRTLFFKKFTVIFIFITLIITWLFSPLAYSAKDEAVLVEEATRYMENVNRESRLLGNSYLTRCQREMGHLYQQMWYDEFMDSVLETAINNAVNDAKKEFSYWTKIKFIYNSEAQEKIQIYILRGIMNRFSYDYELFMDKFLTIYAGEVKDVMEAYAEDLKALRVNEAQFLAGYKEISNQTLEPVVAAITAGVDMPKVPDVFSIGNLKGTGTALSLMALKKLIQKSIKKKIVRKFTKAFGQKLLGLWEWPIGWVVTLGLIGMDVYDTGKIIWEMPEKIAEHFNEALRKAYFDNAPDALWDSISLDVGKLIKSVPAMMTSYDIAVQELTVCGDYREVADSLPPSDQDLLLKKLLLLKERTGIDFCRIAGTLGKPVSQISAANLPCVAAAMNGMSLETVAKWLQETGNDFCKLRELPDAAWTRYGSTLENIDILRWLSKLPKNFQRTGAALPQEIAKWIMTNLNTADQVFLFKNRTADAVTAETARLMKAEQKMLENTGVPQNDVSGHTGKKAKGAVYAIKEIHQKINEIRGSTGHENKPTPVADGIFNLIPAWMLKMVGLILGGTLLVFIFRWMAWLKKITGSAMHDWKINKIKKGN